MGAQLLDLHLRNFKCFEDHTIRFNETTIVVGENNAGKSTIVEALRILGLSCARLSTARIYTKRPDWLEAPAVLKGVRITANDVDAQLHQVFSRYGAPPAIIEAIFSNELTITIYIESENELFAALMKSGKSIDSCHGAKDANLPNIYVLPQIAPLRENETHVREETIRKNRFSKRTSGNFRSMLYDHRDTDEYRRFKELISETWNGILLSSLREEDNVLYLDMRDRDFVTEVYHMGHGIQMWLQTMWFITVAGNNSIIVLDEPDVYMHADLQRKLIRLLKGKYDQTIIATHSVEIMSEVLPDEILIVNRHNPESVFADTYPELQTVIKRMGSIHNINLTRLINNRKYLYVEGSEFPILKILFDCIFPDARYPLDYITSTPTGGWGSWNAQLENAKQFLKEMPKLKVFFIYDRDYHSEAVIAKRKEDAYRNHIGLHVWQKKEIENYLLVPAAIARFICKHQTSCSTDELEKEIYDLMLAISDEMKQDTWDHIEDELCKESRGDGLQSSTIRKKYMPGFEERWSDPLQRLSLLGGKKLFETLSDQCKRKYNVCFSDKQIASELQPEEIPEEMVSLFSEFK